MTFEQVFQYFLELLGTIILGFDSLVVPGSVFVRENCKAPDSNSKKNSVVDILGMPEVILPPGMFLVRQVYLFEKVGPF